MALTNREIVRLLCGDVTQPYVLTDDQVDYYLTINSDDTEAAAKDASAAITQILAVQAINIRTEDLWEDRRETAKAYIEGVEKSNAIKASSAYPVIGGADSYPGPQIDQFDDENNWERTSGDTDYYNGYEDI